MHKIAAQSLERCEAVEQAHQSTYKSEAACATGERTSNNSLKCASHQFEVSGMHAGHLWLLLEKPSQGASHIMISRVEKKITL